MGNLEKLGFFAIAPSRMKDKKGKSLRGAKHYNKMTGVTSELTNRMLGAGLGGLTGALGGGVVGSLLGGKGGSLGGGLAGAVAGMLTGDIRSMRKTERVHGIKQTGPGRYIAQGVSAAAGQTVLPIPIFGAELGRSA